MYFGKRIKRFRINQGLTQEQFGELFGVSKAVVNNWEHNRNFPNKPNLKRVADYMGVTPDDLVINTFDCEVWINFGEEELPKLLGAFRYRPEAELFIEFLKEGNYHKYAKDFEIKEI